MHVIEIDHAVQQIGRKEHNRVKIVFLCRRWKDILHAGWRGREMILISIQSIHLNLRRVTHNPR